MTTYRTISYSDKYQWAVCVGVHVLGYCCDGKQKSQVLWVPLMGRAFNPNLCSSGRASGQGQCGLGSDGHVVNRAATYLPITGPLLEDRTRICNIHSQQANTVCVRVLSLRVCAQAALHPECFWPPGWDNLEFLRAVWVETAWQTSLAPSSSITPTVSPNQNRHIVCLSVHSPTTLTSKSSLLLEIAFWATGMKDEIRVAECAAINCPPVWEGFVWSPNSQNTKKYKECSSHRQCH